MPARDNSEDNLYADLRSLSQSAFPKRCPNCGRVYNSVSDFLNQSETLRAASGLKGSHDDDDQPIVELYRNCKCGSTLLEFFQDRRDTSSAGDRRRQIFDKVLATLVGRGIEEEVARVELRKLMRGQQSELLESFGISLTPRNTGTSE